MVPQTGSSAPSQGDGGPVEAAGYLAEALSELIEIAHAHRLDMLCRLLDMARMEASGIASNRTSAVRSASNEVEI